ncbi:MAG: hypothetical protein ABFE13_24315 [Phycisphaerales bacterium]
MNRQQKRALAILSSMSLTLLLAVAAVMMSILRVCWLSILLLFFVAVVPCAGGVMFFRLRPAGGAVMFDERDMEIQRNANLASFSIAYLFLMLASFAPGFILGEKASIPVTWLPGLAVVAGVCHAYAFFLSLLVQYSRGGKDE